MYAFEPFYIVEIVSKCVATDNVKDSCGQCVALGEQ